MFYIGCRSVASFGDSGRQLRPPAAVDDMNDIEDHQSVGVAERLRHGAGELRGIALVLLDIDRTRHGNHAAGDFLRPLGAALDAV